MIVEGFAVKGLERRSVTELPHRLDQMRTKERSSDRAIVGSIVRARNKALLKVRGFAGSSLAEAGSQEFSRHPTPFGSLASWPIFSHSTRSILELEPSTRTLELLTKRLVALNSKVQMIPVCKIHNTSTLKAESIRQRLHEGVEVGKARTRLRVLNLPIVFVVVLL